MPLLAALKPCWGTGHSDVPLSHAVSEPWFARGTDRQTAPNGLGPVDVAS